MKWKLIVTLDSVDISDRIIDSVSIEAEEDAARIAEFTISANTYGEIKLSKFVGKSVTIDYVSVEPALSAVRVFEGVVDYPEYDIKTRTTSLRCTDDLQRLSKEYMDLTTGEFWTTAPTNTAIYEDTLSGDYTKKTGFEQLEAARSTILYTVDIDRLGNFKAVPFEPKLIPDFIYTESSIIDNSLNVTFATRQQIKNHISIKLDYRYNRLHQLAYSYAWTHPGVCTSLVTGIGFPSLTMIREAAKSTGFHVDSFSYENPPASGWVTCSGEDTAWNIAETLRLNQAQYVDIKLSKRFAQTVTDHYELTVTSPASVEQLGELTSNESASLESDSFNLTEWINNYSYGPFPVGYGSEFIHDTKDMAVSISEVENGIAALVAKSKRDIVNSHRSNFVQFTTVINPILDREHTVEVDTDVVQAKGKVKHLQHNFDTQSGSATTQVKIALSLIDAIGAQPAETPIEAPGGSTTPSGATGLTVDLTTHISNVDLPPTETDDGYITNDTTGGNPHEFRINVPEITTAQQAAVENTITQIYNVAIRDDDLLVTA